MKYFKVGKPILRILAGISAFFLIFLVVVVGASLVFRPKPSQPDISTWKTGMVFFSVGDSWESAAVRSLSAILNISLADSTPSHCGIIIMDDNGPQLVHASTAAGRIVAETPDEYIRKNGSYCLYAKPQSLHLDTIKLKSDIDSLLNKPVAFDFDFDHSDNASLYCTELVVTLYELNGITLLSPLREKSYIYPQDILNMIIKENKHTHRHNP